MDMATTLSAEGTERISRTLGVARAAGYAATSRAVDLGCIYTLDVRPDGSGSLEVSAGWVALEHQGRESFIPAGARSDARPPDRARPQGGSGPRHRA